MSGSTSSAAFARAGVRSRSRPSSSPFTACMPIFLAAVERDCDGPITRGVDGRVLLGFDRRVRWLAAPAERRMTGWLAGLLGEDQLVGSGDSQSIGFLSVNDDD